MKLDKMVLFGMFGMVMMFGVVLPQNVKAADAAGKQRLDYYDNIVSQGKKLSNNEVDEIKNIIRQDDKVDEEEYKYISSILYYDSAFDNKILSNESLNIISAIHNDYASYKASVTEKYPELIDLDSKLPLSTRGVIDQLVQTNFEVNEHLNRDEKIDEGYKKIASTRLMFVSRKLKELQDVLPGSPYREFLTKIYDAEKLLLEENLKILSER